MLYQLGVNPYLPEQYTADKGPNLNIIKTVHIEAISDADGLGEVKNVCSIAQNTCDPKVFAIVANVDLTAENVEERLNDVIQAGSSTTSDNSSMVKGIRMILDHDGTPFGMVEGEKWAGRTHIACSSHNTCETDRDVDLLRNIEGLRKLERGFGMLADKNLSFDLQCCPAQLLGDDNGRSGAIGLIQRHPNVKVVIDHLGKPYRLGMAQNKVSDDAELAQWKNAMQQLSQFRNVYIKISMLGYAVPFWTTCKKKEELLQSLIRYVIELFGVERCMVASNWHCNFSITNSDANDIDAKELTMEFLYEKIVDWVSEYADESEMDWLFRKTAERFYCI